MKEDIFESDNIEKSIFRMAFPAILSSIVTIIYNLTDIFFIGQTGDPRQVAAITISTPVFLILPAFSSIFGMGGGSLISRLLGKKDYDSIKNASSFCFYAGLISSFIFNVIMILLMDPFLFAMGISEETMKFTKEYLTLISFSAYFITFSASFAQIIRSEGASKETTIGIIIGNITNIILDPIFILYFDMGVLGAGIATVIGNIATTIYYLRYLKVHKETKLSISFKFLKIKKHQLYEIFSIGFSSSFAGFLMSISQIIFNKFFALYGDLAIASAGIAMRIFSLVPLIQMGFSFGVQPLLGYNHAALKYEKFRKILIKSTITSIVLSAILILPLTIFSSFIIKLFINNQEIISEGTYFLRILAISTPFIGIFFLIVTTFRAIGKAWPSFVLSICRQGFVFIPALLIGNYFLKLDGVIFSRPISDVFAFGLAIYIFFKIDIFEENNQKIKE